MATVATPAIEIEVDGRKVRVTNPDKVYFPAVGITKRELVEHYGGVGPGILRPLLSGPCCPPPRGKVDAHRTGPNKCRSHPL